MTRAILGDCMEIMAGFKDQEFDLAIVDPPYGMKRSGKPKSTSSHGGHKGYEFKGWDDRPPEQEYFDQLFRVSKNQIIWGANHFIDRIAKNSPCWIIWDKGQRLDQADAELAWTSFKSPVRIFLKNRVDIQKDGAIHPTQKPISLYSWILKKYAKSGDKILDTHLGSGSSRIAADKIGFDFTGIELDEEYFSASCRRFDDYKKQLTLF
jgi:site-specific DNA-methyltransferase (adenine-specific)